MFQSGACGIAAWLGATAAFPVTRRDPHSLDMQQQLSDHGKGLQLNCKHLVLPCACILSVIPLAPLVAPSVPDITTSYVH